MNIKMQRRGEQAICAATNHPRDQAPRRFGMDHDYIRKHLGCPHIKPPHNSQVSSIARQYVDYVHMIEWVAFRSTYLVSKSHHSRKQRGRQYLEKLPTSIPDE